MIRFILPSVLLATALAIALPAQAAGSLTRTFVSSAGSDSNPCTISQPCATFATAYAATAAKGIVTALDPGKYGPLTIFGAVTIDGNGWASITAPAGGNGITINAGSTTRSRLSDWPSTAWGRLTTGSCTIPGAPSSPQPLHQKYSQQRHICRCAEHYVAFRFPYPHVERRLVSGLRRASTFITEA